MAGVVGKALRGFGKALRAHRIKHGGRGKTIKSVKPLSGKIPWWVGAGGKDPGKRAKIVKTHFSNVRHDKIEKAQKQIKGGKENLKKLVDTGQAEKIGERHYKKGFDD
jgi:hypothetical protein